MRKTDDGANFSAPENEADLTMILMQCAAIMSTPEANRIEISWCSNPQIVAVLMAICKHSKEVFALISPDYDVDGDADAQD